MRKTIVCQVTSKFSSTGSEKRQLPVKQITGYEKVVSFSKTKLNLSDRSRPDIVNITKAVQDVH